MRIDTLLQVSQRIDKQTPFHHALKEFMDGVYLTDDKQALINEQPEYLVINDPYVPDAVYNALVAGIADEMVLRFDLERPEWVRQEQYWLKEPFFYCLDKAPRRADLLLTTPSFYRARNVFCGKIFNDKFAK